MLIEGEVVVFHEGSWGYGEGVVAGKVASHVDLVVVGGSAYKALLVFASIPAFLFIFNILNDLVIKSHQHLIVLISPYTLGCN